MKAVATIKQGAALVAVVGGLGVVGAGCLTRPLATGEPTLKTNFTISERNNNVSKVDLLFDIDNSASMGDKQAYLIQAIPDLINRLVSPNCVDANGNYLAASMNGVCATGELEFPPVHDMHLGIVTSALGARTSPTLCQPTAMAGMAGAPFAAVSAHNDDQGHLIARSLNYNATGTDATEGSVADAVVGTYMPSPGGFLWYYPTGAPPAGSPVQPVTTVGAATPMPTGLIGDFSQMVQGAGIWGCGIESQLESWYRFLIQPDPYQSLQTLPSGGNPVDMWVGVDSQILQQRADFLRPDSLVAIIVLTDENDSEIDVRSLGGDGSLFMNAAFTPPKSTAACASDPASGNCVSCSVNKTDPSCTGQNPYQQYSAFNDWGMDANLRHVHMKAKYGVDPQYPIGRYVNGLTSLTVPDRNGEYKDVNGNPTSNYYGLNDCPNPLYMATINTDPTKTCPAAGTWAAGPRTQSSVFYAIIGGVPHELLPDPTLPNAQLGPADWVRILGKGPANMTPTGEPQGSNIDPYDYSGIDPHMIEDYRDRTTVMYTVPGTNTALPVDTTKTGPLVASSTAPAAWPGGAGGGPLNGREWVTDQPYTATMNPPTPHVLPVDRQYACIFPLTTPRDCTLAQNQNSCDCPSNATGLTPAEIPPLCDPKTPTSQTYAKAYPTIRELMVANMMGQQGIVSSLCPIHVTDMSANGTSDPLYGYRPAVTAIINRLKVALNNACLPYTLNVDPNDGTVPCLVLVKMPPNGSSCANPKCDPTLGLVNPSNTSAGSAVLQAYCAQEETTWEAQGRAGTDPATEPVCQLQQLVNMNGGVCATAANPTGVCGNPADFQTGQCTNSTDPGWCYAQNAKGCVQAIEFSTGSPPKGGVASLQCIFAASDGGM